MPQPKTTAAPTHAATSAMLPTCSVSSPASVFATAPAGTGSVSSKDPPSARVTVDAGVYVRGLERSVGARPVESPHLIPSGGAARRSFA